jgi:hypothetical protein
LCPRWFIFPTRGIYLFANIYKYYHQMMNY